MNNDANSGYIGAKINVLNINCIMVLKHASRKINKGICWGGIFIAAQISKTTHR